MAKHGIVVICVACVGIFEGGCITGVENDASYASVSVQSSGNALADDQHQVLGFEMPTDDWSTNNSSSILGASSTASYGTTALSVLPSGWTEVDSVPLSSLGTVKSTVTVDVALPEEVTWGEVRMILVMPSQDVSWKEVGAQTLSGLCANNCRSRWMRTQYRF